VDRMVKIKNVAFSVFVLSSFQLCAMDIKPYKKLKFAMDVEPKKKSGDHCFMNKVLFFVQAMKERNDIIKDVAAVIVHQSCLLRMDSIDKKFTPFFHFYNDSYATMISHYSRDKNLFIAALLPNDEEIKQFEEMSLKNVHRRCRKFDILEPHHLIFFTEEQDNILSSLIARPDCFYDCKGSYSLQVTEKENGQFLMLPAELRELLSIYPKFVTFGSFHNTRSVSDEDSDLYMEVIF
jgi:hypothetical protein